MTSFLRLVTAFLLAGLCGLDLIAIVYARHLFQSGTAWAWRMFFLGKLALAAYMAVGLYIVEWKSTRVALGWQVWRLPFALAGSLLALVAIVWLLRHYSRALLPSERCDNVTTPKRASRVREHGHV